MEEETKETERVRTNITTNAKGLVQIDITSEFPTEEESIKNLDKALKDVKSLIASNGMKMAGAE